MTREHKGLMNYTKR